jgi:hypothetical protein
MIFEVFYASCCCFIISCSAVIFLVLSFHFFFERMNSSCSALQLRYYHFLSLYHMLFDVLLAM